MYEKEDNFFNSKEVRLFRATRELPLYFLRGDRHVSLRLQTPVNCIGKHDIRHPSPQLVMEEEEDEDEETMQISWN